MSLTREQTELSREYQSRLQNAKQISYYANGKYNKVNYQYLMGSSMRLLGYDDAPLKKDNSMVLTDYRGLVVMSSEYASAITSVIGTSGFSGGKGGTFDADKIPEILETLLYSKYSAQQYRDVIAERGISSSYAAHKVNITTGEKGDATTSDNSSKVENEIQSILDFYLPIFEAAAANGWTTEYNKEMMSNEDYISDALISGTFYLESADEYGQYVENSSLTYFLNSDALQRNSNEEMRENITAWYNAERANIAEKENWLDIENKELSTELEAINTEIDAIKSLIQDAISSVFSWGSNA